MLEGNKHTSKGAFLAHGQHGLGVKRVRVTGPGFRGKKEMTPIFSGENWMDVSTSPKTDTEEGEGAYGEDGKRGQTMVSVDRRQGCAGADGVRGAPRDMVCQRGAHPSSLEPRPVLCSQVRPKPVLDATQTSSCSASDFPKMHILVRPQD